MLGQEHSAVYGYNKWKLARLADVFGLASEEPTRHITGTEKSLLNTQCYSGDGNTLGFGRSGSLQFVMKW